MYALLADIVLLLHALIVAFVVFGLVLTLAGGLLGWAWPRNFWFRVTHLALVVVVAVQAWLGVLCPLTIWEQQLRSLAGQPVYEGSFIEFWLHRIIFYEAEPWVFTLVYTLFGLLVAVTWWRLPPRRSGILK
ncbi:MAG: DUF2784 domain-containing protein [Chromatiales bacterium]|nr:DUF2784 domain-containing protein [Chromatiales bacterium]